MNKFTFLAILGAVAPLSAAHLAQAADLQDQQPNTRWGYGHRYPRHHGYGYGYGYGHYNPWYNPYYNPWYGNSCYYGGYGCGYYLQSTDQNFRSTLSGEQGVNSQREQAYLQAAHDAASYLQNGGEQTPALRDAMNTERAVAEHSGIAEARSFDDQTLAQIVVGRAEKMSN